MEKLCTIIEIRPGNGGTDARVFTQELADDITKTLHKNSWVTRLTHQGADIVIHTNVPYATIDHIKGVHTIQRIPDNSNKRHTSSAHIVTRPYTATATDTTVSRSEISVEHYRGSGPGGQHRNKVATGVRITHLPTGIIVAREDSRSQHTNYTNAVKQLTSILRERKDIERHKQTQLRRDIVAQMSETEKKTYTHNEQRGKVTFHPTGQRFPIRKWVKLQDAGKTLSDSAV